mgnify:FL=1
MSYKKFTDNDVFLNTMRAHPQVDFLIYDNKVYYNSRPVQTGSRNSSISFPNDNNQVRNVPVGHINLFEYNIDRPYNVLGHSPSLNGNVTSVPMPSHENALAQAPKDRGRIAPWISKDSARSTFKTVSEVSYNNEFQFGDILQGAYPLSASITRYYVNQYLTSSHNEPTGSGWGWPNTKEEKQWVAIRNRMEFYTAKSLHYKVDGPYGNKNQLDKNIISIPSIFYGTRIKPGTVSLKYNFTGSLMGELQDVRENGELVQVSASNATAYANEVAGVVLYDEGLIILTGSWNLATSSLPLGPGSISEVRANQQPRWINFGVGAEEADKRPRVTGGFDHVSFDFSFKGHTETQTLTMFAHARKGEINYSNNPTFVEKGQTFTEFTSSNVYEQRDDIRIKNTVSSSFSDYLAPFERQVYVSRVGLYDAKKNLIGVATLSNPVLKKEAQDITFKLKLDI